MKRTKKEKIAEHRRSETTAVVSAITGLRCIYKYYKCKQVVEVIRHKAASPPHTDGSARFRQCSPISSTLQSASAQYRCCPLVSRFEYIDRQTGPGVSWAGLCSPSKLPLHVCISGPHLRYSSWGPPRPHPQRYHDQFIRFCTAHGHDRPTDRQTTLLRPWQ